MLRLALLASLAALAVAAGTGLAAGSPKAGKKIFLSSGCGGCHTFKPARTNGKVGPALTKARLTADARRAKQRYALFIRTSIVAPKKYVAKGYSPVMPSFAKLSKKQLADLVAFVSSG